MSKIFQYQKRQRDWNLIKFAFRVLLLLAAGIVVFRQLNSEQLGITRATQRMPDLITKRHIALIDLKGPIWGSFDSAMLSTADSLLPSLRSAFSNTNTVAIVLRINSPGGTTVQSNQIVAEIKRLREAHPTIPIYAVCEEICASAAYHIASACHEIYANPASVIGSLGVTLSGAGFGYEQTLKKLGIERRLITSGDRKGMLDPYLPLNHEDVTIIKEMQAELHRLFIEHVKSERGERLHNIAQNEAELFSGRTWVGTHALSMGLIDQLGGLELVQRKFEVEVINYTPRPDWLLQLRKAAGLNMLAESTQGEFANGLTRPLVGLAQALQGVKDPIVGLLSCRI